MVQQNAVEVNLTTPGERVNSAQTGRFSTLKKRRFGKQSATAFSGESGEKQAIHRPRGKLLFARLIQ